ncbi:MAG: isoprenylcysteine carboxylmethyltransferase family protein [Alphaproteobacteria bacterium]|nr:isoprenylcysteine carboxylmethyltransferase family protein [Alphaproteobacteria bacterium]
MAQELNKNRMRDTKILLAATILVGICGTTSIKDNEALRALFMMSGLVLAAACAIGRIYATAFIGGSKNEKLITTGAYSICRNPLYLFSLMGAAGVGLMSCSLLAFVVIVGGFLFIYDGLIAREEAFLTEKFDADFEAFKKSTPRLMPALNQYNAPVDFTFQPKYLNYAIRDAVWWFAPLVVFELLWSFGFKGFIPLF